MLPLLAENVAESITKGTRVVVAGTLSQRSWENQDGEKRSKVEIVADEVAPSLRWASADIRRNEFKAAVVRRRVAAVAVPCRTRRLRPTTWTRSPSSPRWKTRNQRTRTEERKNDGESQEARQARSEEQRPGS